MQPQLSSNSSDSTADTVVERLSSLTLASSATPTTTKTGNSANGDSDQQQVYDLAADAAELDLIPPPPSQSQHNGLTANASAKPLNATGSCNLTATSDQNNNTSANNSNTNNTDTALLASQLQQAAAMHPLISASFTQSETVFQQISRNTPTTSDSEDLTSTAATHKQQQNNTRAANSMPTTSVSNKSSNAATMSAIFKQLDAAASSEQDRNGKLDTSSFEQQENCYSNDAAAVSAHVEHQQREQAKLSSKFSINIDAIRASEKAFQDRNQYMNDEDEYEGRYDYALVDTLDEPLATARPGSKLAKQDNNSNSNNDAATAAATTVADDGDDDEDEVHSDLIRMMHNFNDPKGSKSEPTTPCNPNPPIAFHQQCLFSKALNASKAPANTLPPDIRKNIINSPIITYIPPYDYQIDQILSKGQLALKSKRYFEAIQLFDDCVRLTNKLSSHWPKEYLVYYYRAETYFQLEKYDSSLADATQARKLNPTCIEAYDKEARSQFYLGKQADSLATFACTLALNPSNEFIFNGFVETARKSNFRDDIEATFCILKERNRFRDPFFVTVVVGQELLQLGYFRHAIVIFESAIKIGHNHLPHRASVYSALSIAYWADNDRERSVYYLKRELEAEIEIKNVKGQCRVYCNLGFTHYLLRRYSESLDYHRRQFSLAISLKEYQQAAIALNAIGHVHVARGDLNCALTSHTSCLEIQKEVGASNYNQCKELVCIGHIHAMMCDFALAEEKYQQSLNLLNLTQDSNLEEVHTIKIMINFNLAYIAIKKGHYQNVQSYYKIVIEEAKALGGTKGMIYEMRAYCGSGRSYMLSKQFRNAEICFEEQLKLAESCKDKAGKSQALCNLGMIFQYYKNYEDARVKFEENLELVRNDPHLVAYARSYMGSVCCSQGKYAESIDHYEKAMRVFQELGGCAAEISTVNMNLRFVIEKFGNLTATIRSTGSRHRKRSPASQMNFSG